MHKQSEGGLPKAAKFPLLLATMLLLAVCNTTAKMSLPSIILVYTIGMITDE